MPLVDVNIRLIWPASSLRTMRLSTKKGGNLFLSTTKWKRRKRKRKQRPNYEDC